MRNFANKLWNAARFVMMNLEIEEIKLPAAEDLAIEDKWIPIEHSVEQTKEAKMIPVYTKLNEKLKTI